MTSLGGTPTRLEISLVGAAGPTDRPGRGLGFVSGGPEQLLSWLEQRLGLTGVDERWWRVELLARGIEAALVGHCYPAWSPLDKVESSFLIDRFGVAGKLLHIRDSLLLECPLTGTPNLDHWAVADYGQLPLLAAAASAAMKAAATFLPGRELKLLRGGVADRLEAVVDALEAGQVLPRFEIVLVEPLSRWPRRWQELFARIHVDAADRVDPAHIQAVIEPSAIVSRAAAKGSALAEWQALIDPAGSEKLPTASGLLAAAASHDRSLAALTCSSMHAACTAVASALAMEFATRIEPADGIATEMEKSLAERGPLPWLDDVTIVCGDDDTAICLDGELARLGMPTFGASAPRIISDLLAILPLAIAARFTPANADRIRELLCLAVPPVDVRLAKKLVQSLGSLPGVGSPKWDQVIGTHPHVEDRVCLQQWIPRPRQDTTGALANGSRGDDGRDTLAVAELREVLDLVEKYALDHRVFDNRGGDPAVQAQFRVLAERARAMGRILAGRPADDRLDSTEIAALLEHVSEEYSARLHPEQAGSPFRVRSLAAIRHHQPEAAVNTRHVIWLGVRSERVAGGDWSSAEFDQLDAAGIRPTRPVHKTLLTRHAEQAGILRITDSLTVVDFPAADASRHAHPLWTLLQDCLSPSGTAKAIVNLDAELAAATAATTAIDVGRWTIPVAWKAPEPSPRQLPEWEIPDDITITPRKRLSWTEVDKRVGCPVAWMLERHGGLWEGRRADVPNAFVLLGSVAEQIIRAEASTWLDDPPADEDAAAARMVEMAERMLPFLWAAVASHAGGNERAELLTALEGTARAIHQYASICDGFGTPLHAFGADVPMKGGHTFTGESDWAPTAGLIVWDFKWGRKKYEAMFENGNFGQLAIYAWNRLERENKASGRWTGKTVDDVIIAYWSVRDATLLRRQKHSTQSVIDALEAMLILGDDLFGTHRRAIAWPLLTPDERLSTEPAGTPLAADLDNWKTHLPRQSGAARDPADTWHICEYCKLDRICGKHSVR